MAIPLSLERLYTQFRRHLGGATSDDRSAYRNFSTEALRASSAIFWVVLGQYSRRASDPPRSLRVKLSSGNLLNNTTLLYNGLYPKSDGEPAP